LLRFVPVFLGTLWHPSAKSLPGDNSHHSRGNQIIRDYVFLYIFGACR